MNVVITSPIDVSPRLERRITFLKSIVVTADFSRMPVLENPGEELCNRFKQTTVLKCIPVRYAPGRTKK